MYRMRALPAAAALLLLFPFASGAAPYTGREPPDPASLVQEGLPPRPIPEPSAIPLFSAGLLLIRAAARRPGRLELPSRSA